MELIGLAQRFAVESSWNGPVESDFLHGLDHKLYVVHQVAGPYGNDVGQTDFNSGSAGTTVLSRAPQATMLRYPYAFRSRRGVSMMTGTPNANYGHSFVWARGGGADETWYQQNSANPILYHAASGDWSQIYNNPLIDLPGGYWFAAPEIGNGIGFAPGTTLANIEAGKLSAHVLADAGNGAFQIYRDRYIVLWMGFRDSNYFAAPSVVPWFTTIATARIADVISNHANPANWTIHKERFAIGLKGVHVCDPAPYDGPSGGRVLISYNQAGLKLLFGQTSLTDLYAELIDE